VEHNTRRNVHGLLTILDACDELRDEMYAQDGAADDRHWLDTLKDLEGLRTVVQAQLLEAIAVFRKDPRRAG
jgi:hypothetical protein